MLNSVKGALKAAKNVVMGTSDIEMMVHEATSMEKWGPTATQMRELTQLSYNDETFYPMMSALIQRLSEPGKFWRHVYKALLVIDYLLKNGSEEVTTYAREHIIEIQTLTHFQHIDEEDKDQGINVRERAKVVLELMHDEAKLADERKRANAARTKFVGLSSDEAPMMRDRSPVTAAAEKWGMNNNSSSSSSSHMSSDYSRGYTAPNDQAKPFTDASHIKSTTTTTTVTTTTTTAAPTKAATMFDLNAPAAPAPKQASILDVLAAPVVNTTASMNYAVPAPAGNDFFDPRGTSSAAAPVAPQPQQQQQQSFFDPRGTAPATAALQPSNSSMAFNDSFGDFAQPKAAKPDVWASNLVNLDSIGSHKKDAASNSATAAKKVPLSSLGATGPAMKSGSTPMAPTMTPMVPATRTMPQPTLMPTTTTTAATTATTNMAPNYAALRPAMGMGYPQQQQMPGYGMPHQQQQQPMPGYGMPQQQQPMPGYGYPIQQQPRRF